MDVIVLLAVGISFFTDVTRRKIYNWVTLSAMSLGLTLHFIDNGMSGLKTSFGGLLTGLGILFIPFLLNGISAGDVKLLAAIGALKGAEFVLQTALFAAIFGGIYIFIYLLQKGKLGETIKRLWQVLKLVAITGGKQRYGWLPSIREGMTTVVPYGTAIFAGTVLTLLVR